MKTCARKDHGKFERDKCPTCCVHNGQVYLQNGVKCFDCGKPLVWVQAHQLTSLEKPLVPEVLKEEEL